LSNLLIDRFIYESQFYGAINTFLTDTGFCFVWI